MTEQEKAELGLWYDANNDTTLRQLRVACDELCYKLNQTSPSNTTSRSEILKQLLPNCSQEIEILSPFYADYGFNIHIGEHTFINRNAYLMDCAKISIGKNCFIGPSCGLYTAIHPLLANERNTGLEKAKPITIGSHVWVGANVVILPGVSIGNYCVIGAGSVVTKDIPSGMLAYGNPCQIIREINETDSIY